MRELKEIYADLKRYRDIVEFDLHFFKDLDVEFIKWHIDRFSRVTSELSIPGKRNKLTIKGKEVSLGYNRLIIGGHGPYIELSKKQLLFEPVVEKGQEWRTEPKYKQCKYEWLTHPDVEIKIYKQKNKVRYADYLPDMFYVDALLFDGVGISTPMDDMEVVGASASDLL